MYGVKVTVRVRRYLTHPSSFLASLRAEVYSPCIFCLKYSETEIQLHDL